MAIVLYHCRDARSLRPLWTLEEMGLEYELRTLPFPPRVLRRDYLEVNPLGTVPYMLDGDTRMSESSAICHYLVERYGPTPLAVSVSEPDYGAYLNWLYFSDATLTFPQTIYLRYTALEPEERRLPQAAEDYKRWFAGRLRAVETATGDRQFLCAGRFTIADICIGYSLHLATAIGLGACLGPNATRYIGLLRTRPSYQRATSAPGTG
jgi:glutathione S-transferase